MMYVIHKKSEYRRRRDKHGWTLLYNGYALYRGLSKQAAINLIHKYREMGGM